MALSKQALVSTIESMEEHERSEFMLLLKAFQETEYYRYNPLEWARDVLGIPAHTMKWSLNPRYLEKGFINADGTYNDDRWDGTPDPISAVMESLAYWRDCAVTSATGTGKAQWVHSHVLTPTGYVEMGDIKLNDHVVGSDGLPTKVIGVYPQGVRSIYRVKFNDGAESLVDAEHLWNVRTRSKKHKTGGDGWDTLTTAQIKRNIEMGSRLEIPVVAPIQHPEADLDVDPYVLGALLGDGSITLHNNISITTADPFMITEINSRQEAVVSDRQHPFQFGFPVRNGWQSLYDYTSRVGLTSCNSHTKFIPSEYLTASFQQRLDLLRGLMDTDGTVCSRTGTAFEYTTVSPRLRDDFISLVRSLGGVCGVSEKELPNGPAYRIRPALPNNINPFLLPRKADIVNPRSEYGSPKRYIESVEFAFNDEAQCIMVDADDSLYLMDDYVVTHNTFIAAVIVLWFLDVYKDGLVITVAPKEDQLKLSLWKEITRLWPKFKIRRPDAEILDLEIRMQPENKAWLARGFVAAVKAGEEVSSRAAGIHAEHMLWVIDETQGVSPAILETIENTLTAPHNIRLALGNPDSTHDALNQLYIRPDFVGVRISGYDHPNIVSNDETTDVREHVMIVPGAVSWKSIYSRRAKYGPDPADYNAHPLYKSRVRGIVPSGSALSLFSNKVLEAVENHQNENTPLPIKDLICRVHEPFAGKPSEGYTTIYERPKHTHIGRYILFADVGGDSGAGDWHACIVFDRIASAVVAVIHMRGHRLDYVREILRVANFFRIYDWETEEYHPPVLNWERNAVGSLHLVPDFADYPELYINRKADKPGGQGEMRTSMGHYTTAGNRKEMIEELRDWGFTLLRHPSRLPDANMLDEFKTFIYNDKKRRYEAAKGAFDDLSMAMAGVLLTNTLLPPPIKIKPAPPHEMMEYTKARDKAIRQGIRGSLKAGRSRRKTMKEDGWSRAVLPRSM